MIDSKDSTNVLFKKAHLNSKDEFIVNLLVGEFSGETKDITIDARIDGVKSLKESHQSAIIESLVGTSTATTPLATIALTTIMPTLLVPAIGSILSLVLKKLVFGKKKNYNLFNE